VAELVAGPLEALDEAALAPFPFRPSFEGLVAERLDTVSNAHVRLTTALNQAASDPFDGIDAAYQTTIVPAAEATDTELATWPSSPAADLVDAGASADTIRVTVAQYLPGAEAPIDTAFVEPPAPPVVVTTGDGEPPLCPDGWTWDSIANMCVQNF
jgi:hypothetical protein